MACLVKVTGYHFYVKMWRQIWKVVWVPRQVKDFRIHSWLGEKSLDILYLMIGFYEQELSQISFREKSQFGMTGWNMINKNSETEIGIQCEGQ